MTQCARLIRGKTTQYRAGKNRGEEMHLLYIFLMFISSGQWGKVNRPIGSGGTWMHRGDDMMSLQENNINKME